MILFDGQCNLCNRSIRWVIRRDTRQNDAGRPGNFDFASLQSRVAEKALERERAVREIPDGIILVEGTGILTKADAALAIARRLRFPWPVVAWIGALMPRRLRDAVYDWVARNRYRWFGRCETCMVPSPEFESRFLDRDERRAARPVAHEGNP